MRWLVPLLLAVALAPAGWGASKRRTPARECHKDGDCVLVTDGCCGCHQGGARRAIPARLRDGYEQQRKALCRNSMCPALMSDHPSCMTSEAVCKDGTCAVKPPAS